MRSGFSLIEVVIVVLIVGVLGGIVVPQISRYTSKRSVANARDAFIHTAAQARAAAIRTGDQVQMRVRPAGDSVVIVTAAHDTVAVLDLRGGSVQADLLGSKRDGAISAANFEVCYVPRGYALPVCGNHPVHRTVVFVSKAGRDTAAVSLSVGQVERQ
jgi:prepilin-type N-terminal cleavage/methylation domain-containing protein